MGDSAAGAEAGTSHRRRVLRRRLHRRLERHRGGVEADARQELVLVQRPGVLRGDSDDARDETPEHRALPRRGDPSAKAQHRVRAHAPRVPARAFTRKDPERSGTRHERAVTSPDGTGLRARYELPAQPLTARGASRLETGEFISGFALDPQGFRFRHVAAQAQHVPELQVPGRDPRVDGPRGAAKRPDGRALRRILVRGGPVGTHHFKVPVGRALVARADRGASRVSAQTPKTPNLAPRRSRRAPAAVLAQGPGRTTRVLRRSRRVEVGDARGVDGPPDGITESRRVRRARAQGATVLRPGVAATAEPARECEQRRTGQRQQRRIHR